MYFFKILYRFFILIVLNFSLVSFFFTSPIFKQYGAHLDSNIMIGTFILTNLILIFEIIIYSIRYKNKKEKELKIMDSNSFLISAAFFVFFPYILFFIYNIFYGLYF